MDITTVNVIIGGGLAFLGSCILFALGAIVAYVRAINRNMKDLLVMVVEHKTKIEVHSDKLLDHDKHIETLYDRVNSLKKRGHYNE